MSIQVKVQARELKDYVHYKKPNKIVSYASVQSDNQSFLEQKIREEVNLLPQKEKKELKKLLKKAKVTSLSSLMVVIPTLVKAESNQQVQELGLPNPSELMELIQIIIEYVTLTGLGIGAIWLLIGGIAYYFPKKHSKAIEIITNAIKGMTHILLVPTIIAILLLLATILLGNSPNFHLPS